MALHVALCRHLDHAEQHSAELVRRLRPSPLHRINILVGSGVASRYTQRRLATPQATQLADQPATQLADQPDTERRALANVSLFTPFDLARQIAARGPSAANPPLPDGADVALLQRVLYELAPQGRLEQFRPDQPGLPAALARTSATCATRTSTPTSCRLGAGPPAARARPGARLRTLARAARDARLQRPAGRLSGRPRRAAAHLA